MNGEIVQEGDGWRLVVVADECMYDDSYIDTWSDLSEEQRNNVRKEIWELIDQDGVWLLDGQVKCIACGNWESIDSCGGFIGTEWKYSGYHECILKTIQEEASERKAS